MYRSTIVALSLTVLLGHGQVSAQGMISSRDAARDPDTAPRAVIDRFSEAAGTLMVRSASNGLPESGQPIDFDHGPFITRGLGPQGQEVAYYNFDVQPSTPAPIYVLFREGEQQPVPGQLNIVDVIPGDPGYNDFWQVVKVTVPEDYVANSMTDVGELRAAGYTMRKTTDLVNCPIVPAGSTAGRRLGGGSTGLMRGWYRGQVVYYFTFEERSLRTTPSGMVPVSPIFVTFNVNPDRAGGGPPSGFRTEDGSSQTHNVLATLPTDAGYSPLWQVSVYDNAGFPRVRDLGSLGEAAILAPGVALVNCPVVYVKT
ncbi:MAG: hypothetical protein R3195_03835 [Gemmatimonadota bacterium]|nr:hypothetical protein [Gemmatimonadota bacterium]